MLTCRNGFYRIHTSLVIYSFPAAIPRHITICDRPTDRPTNQWRLHVTCVDPTNYTETQETDELIDFPLINCIVSFFFRLVSRIFGKSRGNNRRTNGRKEIRIEKLQSRNLFDTYLLGIVLKIIVWP